MPGSLASEGQDSWLQGDERSGELCALRADSQELEDPVSQLLYLGE